MKLNTDKFAKLCGLVLELFDIGQEKERLNLNIPMTDKEDLIYVR